jgi:hypothetical protein
VEPIGTPVLQNALPSVETIPVATIDNSILYAVVEVFRKKANDLYIEGHYDASVHQCTLALAAHNCMAIANRSDDRRAILLLNQAAALLMFGAYELVVHNCKEAATFVTGLKPYARGEIALSGEDGPLLKAKVYTRLGRALIKKGDLDDAATIQVTFDSIGNVSLENEKLLSQVRIDASDGKTNISCCKAAVDASKKRGLDAWTVSTLSSINSLLSLAPGSQAFLECGMLGLSKSVA